MPIPNVVGMSFTQAEQLLQSAGFKVAGVRNPPGKTVVSTSPSGAAPPGSTITVTYGSQPNTQAVSAATVTPGAA
jgi:beta-lactam-binding protein with PASTA domain